MIERLYFNNYRCLENCTLDLGGLESALVIGKNGAGKSTIRQAIGIFQKICRGPNRVGKWIDASDFTLHRKHIPMRFEIEATIATTRIKYAIAFEMPETFHEARVAEESLSIDGNLVFNRHLAQVTLHNGTAFGIDWHFAALPIIQERGFEAVIRKFKSFCASMILVAPTPSLISGFSEKETFELAEHAENLSDWLNALLHRKPESYDRILKYLQGLIPDLISFENIPRGESGNQLLVAFKNENADVPFIIEFKKLSDGEKCFFLSALIIVSNRVFEPLFCFWDEPDNHLSLSEIGHFIMHLRKITNQQGQFLAASHHPETIHRFSDENTIVLTRKSHLEPTVVRLLSEFQYNGGLVESLVRDEVIG